MKKSSLLSLFLFSFLCLSTSAMAAAARTITFDFTDATNPWELPMEYVIGEHSYTNDSLTVLINGAGYSDQGTTKGGAQLYMSKDASIVALMMGKKDSYITLPAFPFPVSTIRTFGVSGGSSAVTFNVYVGDTAVSTQVKGCATDQEFKITKSHNASGNCYTIRVNNANNIRLGRILVTEAVVGAPEKPIFSPKSGTFSSPQLVALTCTTDSVVIMYSLDGGDTYTAYTSPILVSQTTTILAKAIKNELESELTSATYTIITTTGSGTKDDPYTVEDVALLNNPGDSAWVTGIILGCPNNKGGLSIKDTTDNNILLGTLSTDSTGVPVNLAKKAIKEAVGLATNPGNKGRTIKVYGALVEYFKVPGVQKTSDYEIIVPPGTPETPKFSVASGTYITPQTVEITCATDSAIISYSYDGESFTLYTNPLLISTSATLYAKAEKSGLTSGVAQATYTFYTPVGEGSKENPFTVSDVLHLGNPGDSAWVTGIILGCSDTGGKLSTKTPVTTNILIGESADDQTGVPVYLSKDTIKTPLNIVDNPSNVGLSVKVYGSLVSYFSANGVKNVSDYDLSVPPGTPEKPTFSLTGGTYTSAQLVSIDCATQEAAITYSFDNINYENYTEPILIEQTTTLYAKATNNELSSMAKATYTIVQLVGDGTEDNSYTISDLNLLNNPGDSAWVGGYIIGCAGSTGSLLRDSVTSNNVLIADSVTATKGAPVRLSTDELKQAVGLVDHPNNLGKFLKVYGKMAKYLSKPGVTNVSEYILEGGPTFLQPYTDSPTHRFTKILMNGRLLILRDGVYYNTLGNRIY